MRISDWSSDVCSSDLADGYLATVAPVYGAVSSIDACLGAYCQHGDNHSDFADRLAERARWRIAHDFHRLDALSQRAAEVGLTLPQDVCLHDPTHLEERLRSEERRVGKESVSTCRSRGSPYP